MFKAFLYRVFLLESETWAAMIVCAVSLAFGALIGCVFAAYCKIDALSSAVGAILPYMGPAKFSGAAVTVFKYPTALFLGGLAVFGILSIPATFAYRGFSLAFAVTSFIRLYNAVGAVYSMAVFAVQLILVLPCMLLLGAQALISSGALVSFFVGMKTTNKVFSAKYFIRFALCSFVLIAGAFTEKYLIPVLAQAAATFLNF